MTPEELIEGIRDAFGWIEDREMRVGAIWLNPAEIEVLSTLHNLFDVETNRQVDRYVSEQSGARLVGYIFGALVFNAISVPEEHIAITPDGMMATVADGTATMPLRYTRRTQPIVQTAQEPQLPIEPPKPARTIWERLEESNGL